MNMPNKRGNKKTFTNIAFTDDTITFKRKGHIVSGTVTKVSETSVIVSITDEMADILEYSTPLTVVGHNNYKIFKSATKRA